MKVEGRLNNGEKTLTNFYYWTLSVVDKMNDKWLPDVSVEVEIGYETEFKIKGLGDGSVYLDIKDESREFTKFESTGSG